MHRMRDGVDKGKWIIVFYTLEERCCLVGDIIFGSKRDHQYIAEI